VPEGMVGRALDFVKVREGFSGIAENLLGNIMIVQDLQSAFALKGAAKHCIMATLDGEIVEPSGAVVSGEAKGIFQRKREIRELEEMIEAKKSVIEKSSNEILRIQNSIQEKKEAIKEVEASIFDMEKEMSLSKLVVENYMEDKERANRKLAYLAIEIEEIARETGALRVHVDNGEAQMQLTDGKKTKSEQEILHIQEEIALKKTELEQCRSDVTDSKLLTASTSERIEALKNEIDTAHKMLEDLKNRKQVLIDERESLHFRKKERESEISGLEEKLKKMVSEADSFRSDLSRQKDAIDNENEDLLSVEQELRTFRQNISDISSGIAESDVVRAEQKFRMENLSENIRQNYGLDIGAVVLEEVTQEEEDRLLFLKKKIEEIGPVNLGTLDEYEELRDRYEFMNKQQEDLHKSIAELQEAISKINSTTRKRLREAFEALKIKFAEVFTTLFDGGRAELVLTDEHNILETGIEIIAQPPGKKLQNINLLSGGEKALAALALQFASFLIKPTPMCILDEADAPLDDTNTERFAQMLIELSKETQFLVVTHNKTTMNIAQNLYGITMEEAGVSKVISMQLAEV
jgi:chromosome segregation protein